MLPDFLNVLISTVTHSLESIARLGVEALKQLIEKTGPQFDAAHWDLIAASVQALFEKTTPVAIQDELYSALMSQKQPPQNQLSKGARGGGAGTSAALDHSRSSQQTQHQHSPKTGHQREEHNKVDEVTKTVVTGCVVQLLLIDCVHAMFDKHGKHIPRPVILQLLAALEGSFTFAHDFNQKISLRMELKRLGFMRDMRDLPGLLKQELEGLTCYLGILFSLYNMQRLDEELCEKLLSCCRQVMHNYVKKDRLMQTMIREGEDEVLSRGGKTCIFSGAL